MAGRFSRREVLRFGGLALAGLSGCVTVNTDPRDESNKETTASAVEDIDLGSNSTWNPSDASTTTEETTETTTEHTIDTKCTNAYVANFEWTNNSPLEEDKFTATIINQADVAGEIVVEVTFYESEDQEVRTGSLERKGGISAQESKDIVIEANPPTDDSNWASMSVVDQACVLDFEDDEN